jgi:hypothetical protein
MHARQKIYFTTYLMRKELQASNKVMDLHEQESDKKT